RGDACAFLGDRFLGNLNQNLLAGLEQFADRRQVRGLHGAAAAAAVAASTRAFAVRCAAGMAWAISPVTAAEAASVTTSIAASTASIAAAVAIACGTAKPRLGLVEAVAGRGFSTFRELLVQDILFGVRLIELFVFGLLNSAEMFKGGIVDA